MVSSSICSTTFLASLQCPSLVQFFAYLEFLSMAHWKWKIYEIKSYFLLIKSMSGLPSRIGLIDCLSKLFYAFHFVEHKIIIPLLVNFSHQILLVVFHWRLSEKVSSVFQVSPQYYCRYWKWCNLDDLDSPTNFQFFQSSF